MVFNARKLECRFEPSSMRVVRTMLDMAAVAPADVVYDLGCGDGRLVIAAARLGARAVGIDINPRRIEKCRANAERAGVADRVRFEEADLLDVDLREATVVTLFLSPTLNLRLRPRLLADLAPGARVVSHFHAMGRWAPDEVEVLPSRGRFREHPVMLWVIPTRSFRAASR